MPSVRESGGITLVLRGACRRRVVAVDQNIAVCEAMPAKPSRYLRMPDAVRMTYALLGSRDEEASNATLYHFAKRGVSAWRMDW